MIRMSTTFVAADQYNLSAVRLEEWTDPPPMDSGAPLPSAVSLGRSLLLAYVCGGPPVKDVYSAILRFDEVSEHYLGPPNDEAVHLHPLYGVGLRHYSFFEVLGSPKAVAPLRHWILTFHGETAEIVAQSGKVDLKRADGENTRDIVARRAAASR